MTRRRRRRNLDDDSNSSGGMWMVGLAAAAGIGIAWAAMNRRRRPQPQPVMPMMPVMPAVMPTTTTPTPNPVEDPATYKQHPRNTNLQVSLKDADKAIVAAAVEAAKKHRRFKVFEIRRHLDQTQPNEFYWEIDVDGYTMQSKDEQQSFKDTLVNMQRTLIVSIEEFTHRDVVHVVILRIREVGPTRIEKTYCGLYPVKVVAFQPLGQRDGLIGKLRDLLSVDANYPAPDPSEEYDEKHHRMRLIWNTDTLKNFDKHKEEFLRTIKLEFSHPFLKKHGLKTTQVGKRFSVFVNDWSDLTPLLPRHDGGVTFEEMGYSP